MIRSLRDWLADQVGALIAPAARAVAIEVARHVHVHADTQVHVHVGDDDV